MKIRHLVTIAGICLIAVVSLTVARQQMGEAHSEVERSNPEANAVLTNVPAHIEIIFSQEIDASGTVIEVVGPDGSQVDLGDTELDLMDPDRKRVTVSLNVDAGPGVYTVNWTTLSSEDAEGATGSFVFTVSRAGTPIASPAASPSASPIGSATGTPAS